MPPEIYGDKKYSNKVDVWSLGTVVYEMCAFRSPWAEAVMRRLGKLAYPLTPGLTEYP